MKIAICDDNKEICSYLEQKIKAKYGEINGETTEISIYYTAEDMYNKLIFESPESQILLLDICLESDDGIELAKKLLKHNPNLKIIFITGYVENAGRIFDIEPVYFLVKPIEEHRLYEAIDRAIEKISSMDQRASEAAYIMLHQQGVLRKVPAKEIEYIESEGRKLYLHMTEETIILYMKLDEFLEKLDDSFIRCHKSFAVSFDRIVKLQGKSFQLRNGAEIPISRKYFDTVKARFMNMV